MTPMPEVIRVMVESGAKRVFANALDWPGWSRSGRTEQAAVDALLCYAARYAPVAEGAGLVLPTAPGIDIVDRAVGTATTDFGAPDVACAEDHEVPAPAEADRLARLLASSWRVFDQVAAASPEELRKGPRGGGRDRTAMVRHVLGAQAAYARALGLSAREPEPDDEPAIAAQQQALLEVIRSGLPGANPRRTRLWPVRYGARRLAWHVLDHAWEMEDRRD